jgi:hypothetical protein
MNEPGYGPMWWGICVVVAFTVAVSIRFASDSDGVAAGYQMSGGAFRNLVPAAGTADLTAR